MAAMTEAEMLEVVSDLYGDSDDDIEGSIVAPPDATEQLNLVQLQDGIPIHLWRRSISFLTIREQAVSVRGMSRFFRECSNVYMQNFWSEPILHLPQDARSLERAMEMLQYLMRQEVGYVEGTTVVVVKLGSGVYEVVGSCEVLEFGTLQKTLSIPCDNLSFVGKGEGETIVHGCFVVVNGRNASFEGLTVKGSSGDGVISSGVGTKIFLKNVTMEKCQESGVSVYSGAKLVAKDCQICQNGLYGVFVDGSTTTAHLTNCNSHHNRCDGVFAYRGAVVDLMGEGTSVHNNESFFIFCFRSHINY